MWHARLISVLFEQVLPGSYTDWIYTQPTVRDCLDGIIQQ